jgi:hypothetical protein
MRYFNHRSRSHLHRTGSLFFLLFCVASWAGAQTAQIPSAEVEKRVDVLLAKMTLDEKIALIGGINDFYIQAQCANHPDWNGNGRNSFRHSSRRC